MVVGVIWFYRLWLYDITQPLAIKTIKGVIWFDMVYFHLICFFHLIWVFFTLYHLYHMGTTIGI